MSAEGDTFRNALVALATYPIGGLAEMVRFLGGTKQTAALLHAKRPRKQPGPGIGRREVQLYLAHERQGEPGAPKHHRAIPADQLKLIGLAVNEQALQNLILEARKMGLWSSVEAWLKISDKPFYREIGPVLITHEQRDDADRSLLTLLCDAAARHLWDAAYAFWEKAFFQAYDFEEAAFDWDDADGIESLILALGSEEIDQSGA